MFDVQSAFPDVTPIPQDDGPAPICAIQYPAHFSMVMGYFRACLATQELSERTLKLTAEVIDTNPANYTAWHTRRKCLSALRKGLAEEMEVSRGWRGGGGGIGG